jgi:hypothetical protein
MNICLNFVISLASPHVATKIKPALNCGMINLYSSGDHESRLTQKNQKFQACIGSPVLLWLNYHLRGEFMPKINNVKMG